MCVKKNTYFWLSFFIFGSLKKPIKTENLLLFASFEELQQIAGDRKVVIVTAVVVVVVAQQGSLPRSVRPATTGTRRNSASTSTGPSRGTPETRGSARGDRGSGYRIH